MRRAGWQRYPRARRGDPLLRAATRWRGRWSAVPDGPARRTGDALVWPVRLGRRPALMKAVAADSDEARAGAFLAALGGRGAARVLRQAGPVLLLERVETVRPSLAAMALGGADDRATQLLCAAAVAVRAAKVAGGFLVQDRGRMLGDLLRRGRVPGDLVPEFARGRDAAAELARGPRDGWTGLHGDLHHANLLRDRRRGWLLIDPKGIRGPPGYEIANLLGNPFPELRTVDPRQLGRRAAVIAEATGMARGEVMHWTWLHGLFGAAWSLGDAELDHWLTVSRVARALGG